MYCSISQSITVWSLLYCRMRFIWHGIVFDDNSPFSCPAAKSFQWVYTKLLTALGDGKTLDKMSVQWGRIVTDGSNNTMKLITIHFLSCFYDAQGWCYDNKRFNCPRINENPAHRMASLMCHGNVYLWKSRIYSLWSVIILENKCFFWHGYIAVIGTYVRLAESEPTA